MEKVFDYRIAPQVVLEAQERLDYITNRQLIQLSDYLSILEKEERKTGMDYVMNLLIPALKHFAEREEGTIKIIDGSQDDVISVVIALPHGFALDDGNMDVKVAMMMATYISFKAPHENEVEIDLSYEF